MYHNCRVLFINPKTILYVFDIFLLQLENFRRIKVCCHKVVDNKVDVILISVVFRHKIIRPSWNYLQRRPVFVTCL